jgi:hypothetical protein
MLGYTVACFVVHLMLTQHSSHAGRSRVVADVVDVPDALEAGLAVLELVEVEGLRLVELVSVGCPDLVSVHVLLGTPGRAVPQLPVALVARHQGVGLHLELQELRGTVELLRGVTRPEVGLVMHRGVSVTDTECRV